MRHVFRRGSIESGFGRLAIGGVRLKVGYATELDETYIRNHDHHILESLISRKIVQHEIYMVRDEDVGNIGWLRYGYFWDNTPFMNLIWIDEPYRGKGIGMQTVLFWEDEMRKQGIDKVMTSTLSSEQAQHLYRKLGYRDAGCLLLPNEPLEIVLMKALT